MMYVFICISSPTPLEAGHGQPALWPSCPQHQGGLILPRLQDQGTHDPGAGSGPLIPLSRIRDPHPGAGSGPGLPVPSCHLVASGGTSAAPGQDWASSAWGRPSSGFGAQGNHPGVTGTERNTPHPPTCSWGHFCAPHPSARAAGRGAPSFPTQTGHTQHRMSRAGCENASRTPEHPWRTLPRVGAPPPGMWAQGPAQGCGERGCGAFPGGCGVFPGGCGTWRGFGGCPSRGGSQTGGGGRAQSTRKGL